MVHEFGTRRVLDQIRNSPPQFGVNICRWYLHATREFVQAISSDDDLHPVVIKSIVLASLLVTRMGRHAPIHDGGFALSPSVRAIPLPNQV